MDYDKTASAIKLEVVLQILILAACDEIYYSHNTAITGSRNEWPAQTKKISESFYYSVQS